MSRRGRVPHRPRQRLLRGWNGSETGGVKCAWGRAGRPSRLVSPLRNARGQLVSVRLAPRAKTLNALTPCRWGQGVQCFRREPYPLRPSSRTMRMAKAYELTIRIRFPLTNRFFGAAKLTRIRAGPWFRLHLRFLGWAPNHPAGRFLTPNALTPSERASAKDGVLLASHASSGLQPLPSYNSLRVSVVKRLDTARCASTREFGHRGPRGSTRFHGVRSASPSLGSHRAPDAPAG